MKISRYYAPCGYLLVLLSTAVGCSTTQKTGGVGLVSVVAQNVVRVAGIRAMQDADFTATKGKLSHVKLTGFVDEQNRGFIDNLVRTKVEDAGARLVSEDKAQVLVQVTVNSAGNDSGGSSRVVASSKRTEGIVDLDLILRDSRDGTKVSTQHVRGEAKYEQSSVMGFQGTGKYFVKERTGEFVEVPNPTNYR